MANSRGKAAGAVCVVGVIISIVLSQYSGQVRTNREGQELIGNAESCRRDPYVCPAGVLTDGMGNTTNVHAGKTDQQIAADWVKNIKLAEQCINRYFRGEDMPTNSFSSMTSAAFNMGCTSLRTYYSSATKKRVETTLHKHAMAGRWAAMCNKLPDFANSNGKKLPGLVIRREKERQLCLTPDKAEG